MPNAEERAKMQFDKFVQRMGEWRECYDGIANEKGKMEFCRMMKEGKRLIYPKDGTGPGDLAYAPWEKFRP